MAFFFVAPIMVLLSSSIVFRLTERYGDTCRRHHGMHQGLTAGGVGTAWAGLRLNPFIHTKRASRHPQSREARAVVPLVPGDPKFTQIFPHVRRTRPRAPSSPSSCRRVRLSAVATSGRLVDGGVSWRQRHAARAAPGAARARQLSAAGKAFGVWGSVPRGLVARRRRAASPFYDDGGGALQSASTRSVSEAGVAPPKPSTWPSREMRK